MSLGGYVVVGAEGRGGGHWGFEVGGELGLFVSDYVGVRERMRWTLECGRNRMLTTGVYEASIRTRLHYTLACA